jgi:hypothetical protein
MLDEDFRFIDRINVFFFLWHYQYIKVFCVINEMSKTWLKSALSFDKYVYTLTNKECVKSGCVLWKNMLTW